MNMLVASYVNRVESRIAEAVADAELSGDLSILTDAATKLAATIPHTGFPNIAAAILDEARAEYRRLVSAKEISTKFVAPRESAPRSADDWSRLEVWFLNATKSDQIEYVRKLLTLAEEYASVHPHLARLNDIARDQHGYSLTQHIETCGRCYGSGVYVGAGYVENGVFKGYIGQCFRCHGKKEVTVAQNVKGNNSIKVSWG